MESAEDGSYWKLIAHKHLAVAGGLHAIKIPTGTVGHLVDTQLGAMVQWKTSVNGWKIFLAEIQVFEMPLFSIFIFSYSQTLESNICY